MLTREEDVEILERFREFVGFAIGWKQEMLEDAIWVLENYGTGRKASKAWRKLEYVKLKPLKPNSRWVKPRWFESPLYRWHYRSIPMHIAKILGERAAPRLRTCHSRVLNRIVTVY